MTYKIELTAADIELIGTLLDEQPYKMVADLARRVQSQINDQQMPDVMQVATAGAKRVRKGK